MNTTKEELKLRELWAEAKHVTAAVSEFESSFKDNEAFPGERAALAVSTVIAKKGDEILAKLESIEKRLDVK